MFENLIKKQLNADAQESASAENAEVTTATTNCTCDKPLMMILTGVLTNVTLHLTPKKKKKSTTKCMKTLLYN